MEKQKKNLERDTTETGYRNILKTNFEEVEKGRL